MSAPALPATGTITMFSTTWCGYCRRLKSALDREGIGYTEVNIEDDDGERRLRDERQRRQPDRAHGRVPRRQRRHEPLPRRGQDPPGLMRLRRMAAGGQPGGIP